MIRDLCAMYHCPPDRLQPEWVRWHTILVLGTPEPKEVDYGE